MRAQQVGSRRGGGSPRRTLGLAAAVLAAGLVATDPSAAASGPERPVSDAGAGSVTALQEGVAGELVGRTGAPIAGALIAAAADGAGAGPVPEMAVQTDAKGRFQWPLGPGRYRLDAVADGRTIATLRVTVARGRVARARLTAAGER